MAPLVHDGAGHRPDRCDVWRFCVAHRFDVGKPTWGAWWVWDARLTSELILLFQYIGIILLRASIDDLPRRSRECCLCAGRGG
jgi:hypothetical protein